MDLKEASEITEIQKNWLVAIGDFIIGNLIKFDEFGENLILFKELKFRKHNLMIAVVKVQSYVRSFLYRSRYNKFLHRKKVLGRFLLGVNNKFHEGETWAIIAFRTKQKNIKVEAWNFKIN